MTTTIVVTNLNDGGSGSLRDAISRAAAGDTITFSSALSGGVLRLTSGYLNPNVALTIDGDIDDDGKPDITISGDKNGDDVHIAGSTTITDVAASLAAGKLADNSAVIYSPVALTVDGLILTGGNSTDVSGTGVLSDQTLTLMHSMVAGNRSSSGGGVGARGDLTISDTVISGNVATGGIAAAFGLANVTLTNVTVYGNTSPVGYGGVAGYGTLTIVNSTFTGNQGTGVAAAFGSGSIILRNSILLGDGGGELSGPVSYQGLNIVGLGGDTDGSDGVINASALDTVFASVGANPFTGVQSGLIADNGGDLPTVALRPYSGNPAIDRATGNAIPQTDSRGFARYDVPGYGGVADLGAFEAQDVGVPHLQFAGGAFAISEDQSYLYPTSTVVVSQPNGLSLTMSFTVGHGVLQFSNLSGVTVTAGANGSATVSFQGSITALNNAIAGGLRYTPTADFNGTDTVIVTAADGNVTTTGSFRYLIAAVNDAPTVAVPLAGQSVNEDTLWTYQVPANTFADVDNPTLTYTATLGDGTALPSWLTFTGTTRTFTGTPPANFNGAIDLKVTASDGSLTASDTFTLTVTPVNDAPAVTNAIAGQTSLEDTAWTFQVPADTFGDVDGDTLTYSAAVVGGTPLPNWLTFDPVTRTFSGTPPKDTNGTANLVVTVSDGSLTASSTFTWTVQPVNDAPVVAGGIADQSTLEDAFWSFTIPAGAFSDVDSVLSYTARLADGSILPAWLTFDPGTSTFSGTPPLNFNGSLSIEVTASDGEYAVSDTFTLDVTPVNDRPVVASPVPEQTILEDQPWTFQVPAGTFSDPDGDALTYRGAVAGGTPLPSWITFDPVTLTFSGTPPANVSGKINLAVIASDGSLEIQALVPLTIQPVNDAPTVTNAIADQLVAEDTPWTFQVPANTFADVDGDPLTYSATLGDGSLLPAWLTFTPGTRTFTGTPPADFNGAIDLEVTAADGSLAVSDTFTLTVTPVNDAPRVQTIIADQTSPEDAPWSFQVPANIFLDVDGDTLTYAATLGDGAALPAWLTFDPVTRTFSGTPPADFNGAIDLKVTASDPSRLAASDTFRLTVTPVNDAPTTSLVTLLPAASEDGSRTITTAELLANAFDVDIDALAVSGLAPSSGVLVDNGNGSWTFTPAADDDTSVSFTYTISDGRGGTAAGTATLDLLPVNDVPTARNDLVAAVEGETPQGNVLTNDSDVDSTDTLTVTGIVGGTVGQELVGKYGNLTLQADGSYSYAAQNTTLPEGAVATETFTYTVDDGHGGTATADIIVTVTGGNPPFGNNAPNVRGSIPASFVPEGTGDFDGNETLDFLWRDSTTNAVELWTTAANGAITKSNLGTVGANWTVEAVGNLDGKNGDDIVFRDTATGDVGAWIMRNGGQPSDWRALGKLDAKIDIAGAGDFDGNGTDDLLLVDGSTGAVDVWLQGANAPGARSTVGTLPAGWAVAGIGDLDGNGTDDVLLFNAGTRQLGAWQMSNGKLGGWSDYGTLNAGWEVTEIGNFNGAGPDDIGFYNDTTGADGAWVMSPGRAGGWLAEPAHDDLDPIGVGRFASTTDQILWHNPNTGAVVTF